MICCISSMKQFLLAKNEILLKSVIDLTREIETIKLGIQTKFAAMCWWCVPIQYYPWWFVWNGAMHYHSDTFWITKNICERKTDQLKVCTRTPVCMAGHFTVSLLQSVGRDWLIVSGYSLPGLKLVRLPLWKRICIPLLDAGCGLTGHQPSLSECNTRCYLDFASNGWRNIQAVKRVRQESEVHTRFK